MKYRIAILALLASMFAGCVVRERRPCRMECWWSHGRQVCETRCY
jgi:hypothetical protein